MQQERFFSLYSLALLAARSLAICISLFSFLPVATLAQLPSSGMIGVIAGSGTKLAGAHVRLSRKSSPPTSRECVTDSQGSFRFAGLPWGAYVLEVTADGWQSRQISIELRSDSTVRVKVSLVQKGNEQRHLVTQITDQDLWFGSQFGNFATQTLPNGRDIWSLLQNMEPSTATNRFEIAGLETATPALFGALGASWTENQYLLNGLNVTDPYQPGLPLMNPGLDSLAEFQTVTASKPAAFEGSGENLSLASPEPASRVHGGAWFFGSGTRLQSNNMDARLERLNFPGPETLNSLLDGSAQFGGALPASLASMPFFVAASTQQVSQGLGGFGAPINSGVSQVELRFTPWIRGSQRLDLMYSGQHVFDSADGASPLVAPSATTRENANFNQFQAQWTQSFGPARMLTASFGAVNGVIASGFQPEVQSTATVNLPTLSYSGSAPLATSGVRTTYEAQSTFQNLLNGPWGTHSISLGFDWSRSDIANRWYAINNMLEVLVNGAASEVIQWNTPTEGQQHVQNVAEFIQDSWRPLRWLTLPIGLRIDTSTGGADGAPNAIRWTTLEPRVGFSVPLRLPGFILQGSWSRYGHLLQGRYLDFGNPAALGGQVFSWSDTNGDGIAQPQEIGSRLRVFGGPYSAVNSHLERPFTDEISFDLEENLDTRVTAWVRFFRRDDHRLIGLDNTGVPFSQYTPVQVTDPGFDGIYGTADDQTLTLYNENPSALGHDLLLLTNPSGLRASYKGFEAQLTARVRKSMQLSASFSASRTLARTSPGNSPFENDTGFIGTLGVNPNTLLFSQGRTYFDRAYTGKISAYYAMPRGFYLAAVTSYFDGEPFGRLLFVTGFNQGPFFVRATPVGHPGGYQTQMNSTLDLRLAKDIHLSRGTLSAYFDVFNLLNLNSNTLENALTGPTFSLRVPLAVEAPRTMRLGAAWRF